MLKTLASIALGYLVVQALYSQVSGVHLVLVPPTTANRENYANLETNRV